MQDLSNTKNTAGHQMFYVRLLTKECIINCYIHAAVSKERKELDNLNLDGEERVRPDVEKNVELSTCC